MDWMVNEITKGMGRLYSLSLESTPSADLLEGTIQTWIEAIKSKGVWHESDAPRFRETFAVLIRNSTRWPSPAKFFEVMPSRAETDALMLTRRAGFTDEQRAANLAKLAQLVEGICKPIPGED